MRREHHRIYERFLWIDTEIRRNAYPNSRTIAEHFEISPKTAQRSIDFMRDRFELPLEYSAENRGWYYSEHAFALPAEMLTEGDIVAILMAERLAREYAGSPLGAQIGRALAAAPRLESASTSAMVRCSMNPAPRKEGEPAPIDSFLHSTRSGYPQASAE